MKDYNLHIAIKRHRQLLSLIQILFWKVLSMWVNMHHHSLVIFLITAKAYESNLLITFITIYTVARVRRAFQCLVWDYGLLLTDTAKMSRWSTKTITQGWTAILFNVRTILVNYYSIYLLFKEAPDGRPEVAYFVKSQKYIQPINLDEGLSLQFDGQHDDLGSPLRYFRVE